MIFLSLLGIAAGILLWNTVHPVVGLLVGLIFGSGVGWALLGAALRPGRKAEAKALDALLFEWKARHPGAGRPPVHLANLYLDRLGTQWATPAQFLDRLSQSSHDEAPSAAVRVEGRMVNLLLGSPTTGDGSGTLSLRDNGDIRWDAPTGFIDGGSIREWSESAAMFGPGSTEDPWFLLDPHLKAFVAVPASAAATVAWLRRHHAAKEKTTSS